jgi:hypothetical protein
VTAQPMVVGAGGGVANHMVALLPSFPIRTVRALSSTRSRSSSGGAEAHVLATDGRGGTLPLVAASNVP